MTVLPDVQNSADSRDVHIDEVGIDGVRYPIKFTDGRSAQQQVAEFGIAVSVPAGQRGTHMSRMIEIIDSELSEFDPRELPTVLKAGASRLGSDLFDLRVSFAFFTEVVAPASRLRSQQVHDLAIHARWCKGAVSVVTTVRTDITSLCPCSKAISDYGAHNQRSRVSLSVVGEGDDPYPLAAEELVSMIRSVGSCETYPIVKRPDERVMTMRAHDNPSFVEDIVRDLSLLCRARDLPHCIDVRNVESIHSHDATARLRWGT